MKRNLHGQVNPQYILELVCSYFTAKTNVRKRLVAYTLIQLFDYFPRTEKRVSDLSIITGHVNMFGIEIRYANHILNKSINPNKGNIQTYITGFDDKTVNYILRNVLSEKFPTKDFTLSERLERYKKLRKERTYKGLITPRKRRNLLEIINNPLVIV